VLVLEAGRSYRLLARNDMGESLMATPAIANRTLYVRGRSHLYAIGKAPSALAAQSESLSGTRWRLW
jgi:hypothetical protein